LNNIFKHFLKKPIFYLYIMFFGITVKIKHMKITKPNYILKDFRNVTIRLNINK